jgi:hypothetical protein
MIVKLSESSSPRTTKATVARAVADYYASLSRKEVEEQSIWGEFALRELSNEGA